MNKYVKTTRIAERLNAVELLTIREDEHDYREQVEITAESICRHRAERPIILISGPSGAGKSTAARLLERYLDERGVQTHTLSLDDYYGTLTPEQEEQMQKRQLNLESPDLLDKELLSEHLQAIRENRPIEVPHFDFATHKRLPDTHTLLRKPDELVILEGTHALNPDVTGDSDDFTSRLYISVRTRIRDAADHEMHPMKIRLLRRMLRDRQFRGRDVERTLSMLESVQHGEDVYIMPYKYRSTDDINTFLSYELSVYKPMLYDTLKDMTEANPVLSDLVQVMSELPSISPENVPADSVVREFIGGSQIEY